MIKKYILIILIFSFYNSAISQNSTCQNEKIGFSFYANYLHLNKVNAENSDYDSIISKTKPGFILSVNLNYRIMNNVKIEAGVGFHQRNYSYDYYSNSCKNNYRFFTQELKYNYLHIPLSVIYEKPLTNKLSGLGTLNFSYNFLMNYKNTVDNYHDFSFFVTHYNKGNNFYAFAMNIGVNYKISKNFKIPLTISIEKNNFKSISNTIYQRLLINSCIIGIKTGIMFN